MPDACRVALAPGVCREGAIGGVATGRCRPRESVQGRIDGCGDAIVPAPKRWRQQVRWARREQLPHRTLARRERARVETGVGALARRDECTEDLVDQKRAERAHDAIAGGWRGGMPAPVLHEATRRISARVGNARLRCERGEQEVAPPLEEERAIVELQTQEILRTRAVQLEQRIA